MSSWHEESSRLPERCIFFKQSAIAYSAVNCYIGPLRDQSSLGTASYCTFCLKQHLSCLKWSLQALARLAIVTLQETYPTQIWLQIAESAEEVLRREEAKKDKLCQELNLLVQQSAHAQLERLEQLTQRMESLNRGFLQSSTGSQRAPEEPSARQNDASQDELSSEPHPQGSASSSN